MGSFNCSTCLFSKILFTDARKLRARINEIKAQRYEEGSGEGVPGSTSESTTTSSINNDDAGSGSGEGVPGNTPINNDDAGSGSGEGVCMCDSKLDPTKFFFLT